MISSTETDAILGFGKKEVVEFSLDLDQQAQLYALDAELDAAAALRGSGEIFEVTLMKVEYSSAVIDGVKKLWESGGWVVGVFEITTGCWINGVHSENEPAWRIVFARPPIKTGLPQLKVSEALEKRREAQELVFEEGVPVVSSGMPRTSGGLLVRMPTRSRPAQALEVLQKWRDMASEHVQIEVIIDYDDFTMNNTQVLQRLSDLDCTVTIGRHKNKIEACNAGRVEDWSVLVLASDDMVPVVQNYDLRIIEAYEKHYPLWDGSLCYDDGYNKEHVRHGEPITCTLPILGRQLYEDYGRQVYHPGYRSIFCDTDQTFLFTKMNRMTFVDERIVDHRHPAAGKARFDELYQENTRHDAGDEALFAARRARGFDAPQLTLSILICSTHQRRRQLVKLVEFLRWQTRAFPQKVEICVDCDERATVGAKRQRLLERAVGTYVVFVDDDDWVHEQYVTRLLKASESSPDCASLVGIYTVNGENPRRFEHSIKYERWEELDGLLVRTPNHLSMIKRSIALQVGYPDKSVGEDHAFSSAVRPLLKTEADTGADPLYFYWSRPSQSVQSR